MSQNFADLILGADTTGLLKGKKALEDTTKAGAATEKAVGGTEKGFVRAGRGAGAAAPQVERFSKATSAAQGAAVAATRVLVGLAGAFVSMQAIGASVTMARSFNAAMAETSTLIEGTPQQLKEIEAAAKSMSSEFGGSATAQVKAFYQALSAGADGVAGATTVLDQANKLAVGGVTDVTTGVDALTTAMNAYGPDVLSAAQASDAMFVAMRAGKTTIGELSGSLGQIVPIASSVGVSFDEVTAGIAALTTQGLSTSAATTGLRQVLAAVIKPTKEATDAAAALGIEFDVQAVKANGLSGFLQDVIEKTGGNEAAMAQLFGSVEALGAVLAFAGGAGGTFSNILEDMGNKAGATDEAYIKMSESLNQRWIVVVGQAQNVALSLGNALIAVIVPAFEAAAQIAGFLAGNIDVLGVALTAIAATAIPRAVAALVTYGAGMTAAGVATGTLTAAATAARFALIALGGPIGIVFGLLGAAAGAFLLFGDNAGTAETAAYDAEAGTQALADALDAVTLAEPASSAAVIALANNNVKLADSAYEAATAELAKRRAMLGEAEAVAGGGRSRRGAILGNERLVREATEAQTAAENALATAIRDRKLASEDIAMTLPTVVLETNAVTSSTRTAEDAAKLLSDTLAGSGGSTAGAAKEATKELEAMADEIKQLEFDADPLKKYNAEIAKLDKLVSAGLSDGAYQKAVADLNEEFANSDPLISGIGDAIGDFVAGGMRSFGDLLDSFKNMIKQMIATAIANPIKLALSAALGGGGTAAAAGQIATAPGGGGILGGLSAGVGNFVGTLGGAGGLLGGASSVFSGLMSGGLGGAASAIGSAVTGIGSAATMLGGLGAAIGAVALPVAAVAAVFSFFKSKTKELDAGLRVTIDGMDTLVETFSTIEKKKFWGLSKKVSTSFTAAEASVADPLEAIVAQMQGSVLDAAGSLGVGAEAYEAFAHEVQISTKGLSEEDAQRAVVEALNGIGNAFAALTPDLEQFMREGEEAGDTLTRLASDLGAVNLMMDTLGHTLQEATVIGAGTASDFAAMFGGIQAMNAATTAFFTGFYSEAERFATAQRQIEAQFSALGVTTPQTRDQFRAMVDILDLTTESGRSMYASLVSLSSALDAVLPAVSSFTAQIAAMVGAISTEIDTIIGEATTAMRSNEQAAALWYRTADTLRGVITDMRSTAGALISGAKAREFSETRFQTLLASAMAGDSGAAAGLGAAARTLLDNTKATATTALEVARAEARVISDLQLAGGVSDIEGARHDVIAGLMGQQVDLLEGVRDAINSGDLSADDIDGLNAQMGALEGAIKAAEMINYAFLQERLSVSVDLIADADIPQPIRDLLANTATGITATIDYIVRAPDLTPDLRWLALTGTSSHVSTLELIADDRLTNAQRQIALLDLGADTAVLRNVVMRATYATDTTAAQRSIIDAIGGSVDGRITLGGSFQFDPSTGFQTWYATTTRAAITVPMAGLQLSLNALADQIRADMADRAAAAARAQYLAGLQAQLGTVAGTRQTAIDEAAGVMGQIRDLEARTGVDIRNGSSDAVMGFHAGGNVNYQASHVSYSSGSDLAGFNSAFRGPNGLEAQLMALGQIPAAYNQQINGLRAQIAGMGAVPAFATGGTHMGGLRMVGENGPELEVTGPSRIYSAPQTRAMLSGGDNARLEMLVEKLTMEVARMRDENTQLAKNRGTDLRRVRLIEERRAAAEELL